MQIQPTQSGLIDIHFQDVNYTIRTKEGENRQVLKGLQGFCPGGKVTAIMGSSGAGKTSLLNIMAFRVANTNTTMVNGTFYANGQVYTESLFTKFASYVMQNDVLLETLTPREALQFVANLKYADPNERTLRAEEAIKQMRLERCQDTLIGGVGFKGISGGERKRTSIGFELVSNPSCVMLDEPTSGLDSFTAFSIINELRKLAHEHSKTIIFTIHQPSSDIFAMFDRIMIMSQGNFIYQGDNNKLIPYFQQIGFPCPVNHNPMDYIMSILHTNNPELNQVLNQNYLNNLQPTVISEIEQGHTGMIMRKNVETTTLYQISVIASRALKNAKRDKLLAKGRMISSIIVGLLIGGVFYGVADNDRSQKSLTSVMGAIFFISVNNLMTSMLPILLQFPVEREVFLREENSKLYTSFAYFIGKTIIEIPFMILAPCVQQLIAYWMIGLNNGDASFVFTHLLVCILLSIAGNSVGLMGGCAFQESKLASAVTPIIEMLFILFSGFFANQKSFASWIGWIAYLSPMKYAFEAMSLNEFIDNEYQVDGADQYGFEIGLWDCVGILIGVMIAYRMLAFMFLVLFKSKLQ